ncbi:MAG: MauE/DoxX family redox-associated membrane protein [Opitutales bacterium]
MAEESSSRGWKAYIPIMVLVSFTLLAGLAKQLDYGSWQMMPFMRDFMGFFLVVFAMFKFFDLPGFADGFQMYDLLAKRTRAYALVYPFIELGLGLWLLTGLVPLVAFGVLLAVMAFGAVGVALALHRGLDINCACMGTTLKVPLSTVALTEDVGMAGMAAVMLIA